MSMSIADIQPWRWPVPTSSSGQGGDPTVLLGGYMQVLGRRCSPPKLSGSVKLIAEAALLA